MFLASLKGEKGTAGQDKVDRQTQLTAGDTPTQEAIAREEYLPVSQALRRLIISEAKRRGLWPAADLGGGGGQQDSKPTEA